MKIAITGPADPASFARWLPPVQSLPAGIGGTPVTRLTRALLDLGHNVHLLTVSRDVARPLDLQGENFRLTVVPYRHRARERAKDLFREERRYLLGHLRDSGPDVVHAHWTYEFAWASLAGSANVLVTAHDAPLSVLRYSPDIYRAIRTGMAYYVRAGIQHLTVVSPYLAKQWRRQMAYRRDIRVIPNPIPDLRPAGEAADKGPIVLDIADASPRKNVQRLIQSFGQVRRVLPKAELRLVGPGLGPCDPMATWASKEELGTNVSFLGELDRPQVERQLDQAAVLCHPSLEEAQPMCLLEAMAKRVPIIGGRSSGGVPWTLQGGRCGVLVDVRSTDDLARNMLRLLRASKERESLAAAAFEFVYTRFAPEYIAQQYIESYRSILSA